MKRDHRGFVEERVPVLRAQHVCAREFTRFDFDPECHVLHGSHAEETYRMCRLVSKPLGDRYNTALDFYESSFFLLFRIQLKSYKISVSKHYIILKKIIMYTH